MDTRQRGLSGTFLQGWDKQPPARAPRRLFPASLGQRDGASAPGGHLLSALPASACSRTRLGARVPAEARAARAGSGHVLTAACGSPCPPAGVPWCGRWPSRLPARRLFSELVTLQWLKCKHTGCLQRPLQSHRVGPPGRSPGSAAGLGLRCPAMSLLKPPVACLPRWTVLVLTDTCSGACVVVGACGRVLGRHEL